MMVKPNPPARVYRTKKTMLLLSFIARANRGVSLYEIFAAFNISQPPSASAYRSMKKTLARLENMRLINRAETHGHNRTTWFLTEDGITLAMEFIAEFNENRYQVENALKTADALLEKKTSNIVSSSGMKRSVSK